MYTIKLRDSITKGFSDDQLMKFCAENRDLRIERNSNMELILRPPVTTQLGIGIGELLFALMTWNETVTKGLVFNSRAGFTLPDQSVFASTVSWLSQEKWSKLSRKDKIRFAPVCPEFVVEVRSESDDLEDLKKKMQVWIKNGAQLAWLIDPIEEISWIFKPGKPLEKIEGFKNVKLKGEGPVEGFTLDLSLLKID